MKNILIYHGEKEAHEKQETLYKKWLNTQNQEMK